MDQIAKRELGRTGVQVSALALGGVMYNFLDDDAAAAVVHRAIDLGINYIDTANSYKDSERKIGLALGDRRDEVYLATKTERRDYDAASREIDESFERLQVDRIDCLQIHDMHSEEDLATVMGPNGALKAIEQRQREGSIRFVGVTSHVNPDVLARTLEAYPFDTILTSLGALHHAVRPFYDTIMPVAEARGVGVLAMKVFAYGFLKDHAERALRFVMGLPGVASAVVGVDDVAQIEANAAVAQRFAPLSDAEKDELLENARAIYEARRDEAWFIHSA